MNKKGFSLIELVISITILGIIYLIALPSYRGFQAKAHQKQGFALLTMFYSASQSSRMEFGFFPGNLVETGFQPDGILKYRLRSDDNATASAIGAAFKDDNCVNTAMACNCGGLCPDYKTWVETGSGIIGSRLGATTVTHLCGSLAPIGTNDDDFSIRVAGVVNVSAAKRDGYGMDETKNISMCSDGLK